jgi:hypothetical protein
MGMRAAQAFDEPIEEESGEEPQTPTGQYPEPVFADEAQAASLEDDEEEEGEEAVTPTGQYPEPVFADNGAPVAPQMLSAALEDDAEVPESAPPPDASVPITPAEMFRIAGVAARAHSGEAGYAAVQDGGPATGLRFGLMLAPQATGALGSLLALMRQRDASAFDATFGPAAVELLTVTSAPTAAERLAAVGGAPLTDPAWQARFEAAGAVPAFGPAQNEHAVEGVVRPMLDVLLSVGLDSDRGLAMAVDRAIVSGPGEAVAWVLQAAGPLQTAAQRRSALTALGHADVGAFQTAIGLPVTGKFDARTYAGLVAALRAVALPAPDTLSLQARLLAAATGDSGERLDYLRQSPALMDVRYRA